MRYHWLLPLCLIGLVVVWPGLSAGAESVSLRELGASLRLDPESISVSGVSSGAYMAQQFQVAHSSHVKGVGIVAGGPYDCARGSYFWSSFDFTGLYAALHVCSATGLLGVFRGPPDVDQSVVFTRDAGEAGYIDDPAHLAAARVWLFSGANDDKIPRQVMDSTEAYYTTFLASDQIEFVQHPEANHAMITDDFGNACAEDGSPYINDCDFDSAAALLQHIYGPDPLAPKAAGPDLGEPVAIDQADFFDVADLSVSMATVAYVYVPAACAKGAECRLHVAFHGCQQNQDAIGDAFYTDAGYNEVAATNDVVVLYPQTVVWSDSVFSSYQQNPSGCWDWWGYSGEDFSRRSGKQVRAVAGMINALVGADLLSTR